MNRDILKGQWKQLRGEVQQTWGELTNDEVDQVQGEYDKLAGKLQAKYGYARDRAESEIDTWLSKYSSPVTR